MTRDELIEAVAHAIDPRPWTFSSKDDVKRYGEKHDLARRAKSLKTAARVLDALDALNMKPERVAELEKEVQALQHGRDSPKVREFWERQRALAALRGQSDD